MATLALSLAGAAIGPSIFGAGTVAFGLTGAAIGRAVGGLAGSFIDAALLGGSAPKTEGSPKLEDLTVTSSTEGQPIIRLYGRDKIGGQIIWATDFEQQKVKSSGGGKGLGASQPSTTTYNYFANFAVALCEGPISKVGRVWADGKELDLSDYTHRIYLGTEDQQPDSLIEAKQGAGNAPPYRGVAYVVFERMFLEKFGNRLPQLTFEVFKPVGDFEGKIKGACIIPAATEFGYGTVEVRSDVGGGTTASENVHTNFGATDFVIAINDLDDQLPNCANVSLFTAWFGDDLRAADCEIKPRVDTATKDTTPYSWSAAGLTRATADVVSTDNGVAAYGGTPADRTIVEAIKNLKSDTTADDDPDDEDTLIDSHKAFSVAFTPFLLMDIPDGNALTDPYDGATPQPSYPWRGRITCNPAPGEAGTPDKTATAGTQIDTFYGTVTAADFTVDTGAGTVSYSGPSEWSYSRFILHNAALCAAAGGVDVFVIGSEMRGLTWVRESASSYPFVDNLIALAAQVKILLPSAKVTYAADWSEWFGHQPDDGSDDVYFHLDPLWSDSNIDAIGVDFYWPLSDWRDGQDHLDWQAGYRSIYDQAYLNFNFSGGEGYDWFYASDAARDSQTRTTITDGTYGEPWVFRFKDMRSWWWNQHFNRPGGVRDASPTVWVPESKPIWLMEVGCPAVNKGANQPNVFYDPKSSESSYPHYSSGARDDHMQRQYLRAVLDRFGAEASEFDRWGHVYNPVSNVYGGRMVDMARVYVYTWDARPYPAFPYNKVIWADGDNWITGHWITGRTGEATLGELVGEILTDYDFADYDISGLGGAMAGYKLDQLMSARAALQVLENAFFFDSFEDDGKVKFAQRGNNGTALTIDENDLVQLDARSPLYEITRGQESELPEVAKLKFIDADRDYKAAQVESRRLAGRSARISEASYPLVTSYTSAQAMVDTLLYENWAARERASFALPPSKLTLRPSDVVALTVRSGTADARTLNLRLTAIGFAEALPCEARTIEPHLYGSFNTPEREGDPGTVISFGGQLAVFLDIPMITSEDTPHAGRLGAVSDPWPGQVAFYRSPTTSGYEINTLIEQKGTIGETLGDFYSGPTSRWDNGNTIDIAVYSGETLEGADDLLVLGGANYAAIQNADGGWELFQFAAATLIAAGQYRLSRLLRGQRGTEGAMRDPVATGARFVLLDSAVIQAAMTEDDVGLPFNWKYGPAQLPLDDAAYTTVAQSFDGVGLRPYSPVHVEGARDGSDNLTISWIRRDRIGADAWEQVEVPLSEASESYEVDVMDGASVVRTLASSTPSVAYSAANQTTDFGSPQSSVTVRVYQLSATYGRGQYREAVI